MHFALTLFNSSVSTRAVNLSRPTRGCVCLVVSSLFALIGSSAPDCWFCFQKVEGLASEAFFLSVKFALFLLLPLHDVRRWRCKRARLCDLFEYGLSPQWQTEADFCRFAQTGITTFPFARVTAKTTAEDRLSHLALYLVDHCGNSFAFKWNQTVAGSEPHT